ncbi:hypothetical protein D1BOALGB6SA_8913 [Olavius sp. associated proteobacterium Delta 1]|nr:hypothetical protein D1BOALGB6SA_8913 [Olavius sp. associated proteobacterium Delta 1]
MPIRALQKVLDGIVKKYQRFAPVMLTGIPAYQMPPSFNCMPEYVLV